MRMVSMVIVHPKKDAVNDIVNLVNDSRKDGVLGLEVYNIINSNDDELIFINFWESIDAFVEYINSHHNMIELIEHLCVRIVFFSRSQHLDGFSSPTDIKTQ